MQLSAASCFQLSLSLFPAILPHTFCKITCGFCPKQKQTFFLFQDIRIGSIVPISGRKLSQKNLFSLLALGHTLGQKSRRISHAFLSQSQLFFCLNPMRLIRMEINRCHRLNISNLGSSSVCFHATAGTVMKKTGNILWSAKGSEPTRSISASGIRQS